MIPTRIVAAALIWFAAVGGASAQTPPESLPLDSGARFALSTFILLLGGAGALMSVAGLSLRNAGLAPERHRAVSLLHVLGAAALAFLLFWCVGANLAFNIEPGGLLGSPLPRAASGETPVDADPDARAFFFAGLSAIAATISAGAVAERARYWPQGLFVAAFAAVIFPIIASWVWGGGYLSATWAFADLGGAAVVHVAGGAAALAGALILGRRAASSGARTAQEGAASGLPLVALGATLAATGLAMTAAGASGPVQSSEDASLIARVVLNAAIVGACAFATALAMTRIIYRKIDAAIAFNGVIGAMAALSAAPASPAHWQAALIGGMAAVIVALGAPALERVGLDDPAGAVPTHLFCGAWGVLLLPWHQEGATILGQVAGLSIITAFAFVMSALVFVSLRYTIGIRVGPEMEQAGLDQGAIAVHAHREAGLR